MKSGLGLPLALIATGFLLAACQPDLTDGVGRSEVDRSYFIESSGQDMRVYEFTPKTSPGVQCVFVGATQKGGLACFPKPQG